MPWFSVCDRLPEHQKADALEKVCDGDDGRLGMAWMTWLHMGADCMARLTDGRFDVRRALRVVRLGPDNVRRALADLTTAGFLVAHDDEHEFHEWLHYQRSAEQIRREREGNRDRKQRQRAGHAVTPPVTASVTTAGTDAVTHGGSHRPPSPPLPIQKKKTSTVSDVTATSTDAHTVTHSPTPDARAEFERVTEIVRKASEGRCNFALGDAQSQSALSREIAGWTRSGATGDELWQAFGEATKTREGREALFPWCRATGKVAHGVPLSILAGKPEADAQGRLIASWKPLTEALARGVAGLRSAGTDGPVSGQQRALLIDTVECSPEVYASWLPLTPAERNAWQNRFHRVYVAGIPPRNLGWNRYTLAQIEAFEEQLRQREAVEAERGNRPALKVAMG